MLPQPRHFIAAPFLALSGYLLFESLWPLGKLLQKDWVSICLMTLLGVIMAGVPAALGVLALKRRWEEFVQIVAAFAMFVMWILLVRQTNDLNRSIESLAPSRTSFPYIVWSLCVTVAPFVICIVAYKRLVPLILRRIARAHDQAKAVTP